MLAIAIFAIAYAIVARLSLLLEPVGGFASVVWPPTGMAIAAIILLGRRVWPGILIGAFAANTLAGAPTMPAISVAIGNALEAVVASWALGRWRFSQSFDRFSDAVVFIATAAVAPIVSATIGVGSLAASGALRSDAGSAWLAWWLGDFIGALLVTPFALVWWPRGGSGLRGRGVELLTIVGAVVVVTGAVFTTITPPDAALLQTYLVFPVLMWAAIRFEQRGATLAVFLTAVIAIAGTANGLGPFAHSERGRGLFGMQTFMGIAAASVFMLAAALAERSRAREALRQALVDETHTSLSESSGPLHRLLVESVVDYAIFALDRSGHVLSWNRGAERLMGYTAAEIVGKHFSVFHPAEVAAEGLPDHELDVATREGRSEDEGWRIRKDGSRFWANTVLTALRDSSGRVVGFSKVTRDLTARRASEENNRRLAASEAAAIEAHKSERMAQFLSRATAVLASSLDYDLTLNRLAQLVVPELADWCVIDTRADDGGLRRVAVAHKDPERVKFARQVEAEYPTDMSARTGAPNVFRTGQSELYEEITDAVLMASARDERHLSLLRQVGIRSAIIVPIMARDRVDGVLTMVSAESERRYSQADLELAKELGRRAGLAIENALLLAEAEAAAERTSRLQEVTSRLARIVVPDEVGNAVLREGLSALGAKHAAFCVLTPGGDELEILSAVGLPEDVQRHFRRFRIDAPLPLSQAVRTRSGLFLQDRHEIVALFPGLREANSRATTEAWVALPLIVGDRTFGGIAFGFAEARRFTQDDRAFALGLAYQAAQALERTQLYAAERRARAEAEVANRAKADFLATMSHELRTPLNAIGGYAELLEMNIHGPLNSQQAEVVDRIRRSERRLRSLIEDVLSFARLEAGRVQLDTREVNVLAVCTDVEELLAPQLRAKQLRFSTEGFELGLTAHADAERLQQILVNLLSNAIKFTPAGGSITLTVAEADGRVEISVKDTGPGIPADKLETVFEPFVQVGRTLTTPQEGSGLGLAISRDLARAMGGDVTVRSTLGAGSVFTLTLPVVPAHSASAQAVKTI